MEEWETTVDAVELVPGRDGVFDVWLGDDLAFTKSMIGRYPEPADVLPLLRDRLGSDTQR